MENESLVTSPLNYENAYENPQQMESDVESFMNPSDDSTVTTVAVTSTSEQVSVDNVLDGIYANTKQSADCLTTLVAFTSVFIIVMIGKWLYNTFSSIFF